MNSELRVDEITSIEMNLEGSPLLEIPACLLPTAGHNHYMYKTVPAIRSRDCLEKCMDDNGDRG